MMVFAGASFCVNVSSMTVLRVSCMIMTGMSRVVVAEAAGGEGCDEDRQTDEHADAFPCEVARFLDSAFGLARNDSVRTFLAFMLIFAGVVVELESFAVGLDAAVFVVVLVALLNVLSVVDIVYDDADYDSYDE